MKNTIPAIAAMLMVLPASFGSLLMSISHIIMNGQMASFGDMAVGSKKNTLDLEGVTVPVYYAGDCSGERTAGIMEAVRGGYKAANEI